MSGDVVRSDNTAVAVQDSDAAAFIKMISEAARDPNVNVDKMERLMAMKERFDAEQAKIAFNIAMNAVQPRLPRIKKRGAIELKGGARITYSKYEDIEGAVKPILNEHGFSTSYTSEPVPNTGLLKVTITVKHVRGHSDTGSVFLPVTDDSGAKNKVQGAGSVLSYGKRYALCNYFDIVAEDEDDNGSGGGTEPVTLAQVNQLRDMILHTNANESRFLQYMKVARLEDIMQCNFDEAMSALNQKARRG